MKWTVIVTNNSGSDVEITDLGVTIANGQSRTLSDTFGYDELSTSANLKTAIQGGLLVVNNGYVDLNATDGEQYIYLENVYNTEELYVKKTELAASGHDSLTGRTLSDQHPIGAITNLQSELDLKASIVYVDNTMTTHISDFHALSAIHTADVAALSGEIDLVSVSLSAHIADVSNPHSVTATQVTSDGPSNVQTDIDNLESGKQDALSYWTETGGSGWSTWTVVTASPTGNAIIIPKGTGSFQLSYTGDPRGEYANDLQRDRSGGTQVASGNYSFIGGGKENIADGLYGIIVGGWRNKASGSYATVGGGNNNDALSHYSVIAGGVGNETDGSYATIGGGQYNMAANWAFCGGGYQNDAGANYSVVGGGYDNTISPTVSGGGIFSGQNNAMYGYYCTIAGGNGNAISGTNTIRSFFNFIGAGQNNTINIGTTASSIVGGDGASIDGSYSSIIGGYSNTLGGDYGFIGGGSGNTSDSNYSVIVGGSDNTVTNSEWSFVCGGYQCSLLNSSNAFIGGGYQNSVTDALYGFIGTGNNNALSGNYSIIVGGQNNKIRKLTGDHNFIGGGESNIIDGRDDDPLGPSDSNHRYSVIVGGENNLIKGYIYWSNILGGAYNTIYQIANQYSDGSTIVGGDYNEISGAGYSVIAGGEGNVLSGSDYTFIGAGDGNVVGGARSGVVAGRFNSVQGPYAFIGAGHTNYVSSDYSFIGAGNLNEIHTGTNSVIVGGYDNEVTGAESSVVGGRVNVINGMYSFIGGGRWNTIDSNSTYCVVAGGGGGSQALGHDIVNCDYATIGGGTDHTLNASNNSTIGGGYTNGIYSATNSTIGGGYQNSLSGSDGFIGGGRWNKINSGSYSVIAGGGGANTANGNEIDGDNCTIGGGYDNTIEDSCWAGTIAGGEINVISGGIDDGTIGGGYLNVVGRNYCTIGGGEGNQVVTAGTHGTIGGGAYNTVEQTYATIVGGAYAKTRTYGQQAYASGQFSGRGDAQTSSYVLREVIESSTKDWLAPDGVSNGIFIEDNQTMSFIGTVTARTSGDTPDLASWKVEGVVSKNSSDVITVHDYTVTTIYNPTSWTIDISEAATNYWSVGFTATGWSENIRVVADIQTSEVIFA